MNAGTPTSAAPGVSVRGRMRSATAPAIAACADVRRGPCAAGLLARRSLGEGGVDRHQPFGRDDHAGEQGGAANRFAPADERRGRLFV